MVTAAAPRWPDWREHPDQPVDIEDPLAGALKDAELLVAFAARRRRIDPKKLLTLAEAVAKVRAVHLRLRRRDPVLDA